MNYSEDQSDMTVKEARKLIRKVSGLVVETIVVVTHEGDVYNAKISKKQALEALSVKNLDDDDFVSAAYYANEKRFIF